MRPIKVFDKYITYLIVYTSIPEVGANSRLAKVHILKSGPAMAGQAGLVPPPLVQYDHAIKPYHQSAVYTEHTPSLPDQSPIPYKKLQLHVLTLSLSVVSALACRRICTCRSHIIFLSC